jgi:UDP-GlcNAc:undecaprenyl-phosphate GlcNAc-1-phosphate transferase
MINQIIAVLWIIGIINAINFLDIMDGLAAGTSAIAAFAFFGMAIIHKQGLSYTSLAVALSGAALGFLFFNFNPASIFMGDTGSQFLGLLLGVFALTIPSRSLSLEAIAPALIVLGIPLFEITFTSTIRTLKGKAPWKGSKDHYALRLFKLGYSVRKIVLLTYAVGFGLLLCAAAMLYSSLPWKVITFLSLSLFALGSGVWLSRVKVPSPQKKVQATPLTDPQELVNPKSLSIWAEE